MLPSEELLLQTERVVAGRPTRSNQRQSEGESGANLQIVRLSTAYNPDQSGISYKPVRLSKVPVAECIVSLELQLEDDALIEYLLPIQVHIPDRITFRQGSIVQNRLLACRAQRSRRGACPRRALR